jgi:hypothetical protein
VMQARAAFGEILGDAAVLGEWRDQLDLTLARWQKGDVHLLILIVFNVTQRQSERIAPEAKRRFDIFNHNRDVIDPEAPHLQHRLTFRLGLVKIKIYLTNLKIT